MFDGVLLDFYGTVVHEDGDIITEVCQLILDSSTEPGNAADIGTYWWNVFSASFTGSHGEHFQTQRTLEIRSLASTIAHFGASADADALAELLFDHWRRAELFEDAARFLDEVEQPVVIVSNIDRVDIEAAIAHHQLPVDQVITSEDVRSYKPRPELFRAGLAALAVDPDRALHVGDSITSDVAGANRLGIPVAWVNRSGRPVPSNVVLEANVAHLTELLPGLADRAL